MSLQNLFVAKLPRNVTDADLQHIFDGFEPTSAKVMLDAATGKSKGFGFVLFPSEEAGRVAYEALNKKHLAMNGHNFCLYIFPSKHDGKVGMEKSNALYIRNIPRSLTRLQVETALRTFGELTYCAMREDHYGGPVWVVYAEYATEELATQAMETLHGNKTFFNFPVAVLAKYADSEETKRERRRRREAAGLTQRRGNYHHHHLVHTHLHVPHDHNNNNSHNNNNDQSPMLHSYPPYNAAAQTQEHTVNNNGGVHIHAASHMCPTPPQYAHTMPTTTAVATPATTAAATTAVVNVQSPSPMCNGSGNTDVAVAATSALLASSPPPCCSCCSSPPASTSSTAVPPPVMQPQQQTMYGNMATATTTPCCCPQHMRPAPQPLSSSSSMPPAHCYGACGTPMDARMMCPTQPAAGPTSVMTMAAGGDCAAPAYLQAPCVHNSNNNGNYYYNNNNQDNNGYYPQNNSYCAPGLVQGNNGHVAGGYLYAQQQQHSSGNNNNNNGGGSYSQTTGHMAMMPPPFDDGVLMGGSSNSNSFAPATPMCNGCVGGNSTNSNNNSSSYGVGCEQGAMPFRPMGEAASPTSFLGTAAPHQLSPAASVQSSSLSCHVPSPNASLSLTMHGDVATEQQLQAQQLQAQQPPQPQHGCVATSMCGSPPEMTSALLTSGCCAQTYRHNPYAPITPEPSLTQSSSPSTPLESSMYVSSPNVTLHFGGRHYHYGHYKTTSQSFAQDAHHGSCAVHNNGNCTCDMYCMNNTMADRDECDGGVAAAATAAVDASTTVLRSEGTASEAVAEVTTTTVA